MKQPKPPKSFDEVEAYIIENDLCVDPIWFWKSFSVAGWYDTNGKPVLSWKQKLWNLNKLQKSWGKAHPCHQSYCKKTGIYEGGNDRDGHPYYWCADHRPKRKPVLPKEMTNNVLKVVPEGDNRSTSDKVNEQKKKVGLFEVT